MIGQTKLLTELNKLVVDNKLPRFFILNGAKGSGKDLIIKHLSKNFSNFVTVEKGIDDIRRMIRTCYGIASPTLYYINNSEGMSIQAANSLLKILEEPPRIAYFVLAVENLNSRCILPTIKSRATIFKLDPYTPEQLSSYIKETKRNVTAVEDVIVELLCQTPGEVNYLVDNYNIVEFWKYVKLVLAHIGKSSGTNSFKISNKMKFKDDGEGYDPIFFMNALSVYALSCMNQVLKTDPIKLKKYKDSVSIISKYKAEMKILSISKPALFDMFLLDLRQIWK